MNFAGSWRVLHKIGRRGPCSAGPGVWVLTDSDLTTYYYVEACQTLRVAIPNMARGGTARRGGESIKPKLAEHLGIAETRVSKYLADHCVVRWLQWMKCFVLRAFPDCRSAPQPQRIAPLVGLRFANRLPQNLQYLLLSSNPLFLPSVSPVRWPLAPFNPLFSPFTASLWCLPP